MSLEFNVKKWIELDNKYKKISEELNDIKSKKKILNDDIINYFNNNNNNNNNNDKLNIQYPCIKISDGKLNVIDIKTSNVITYKFLLDCLNNFFRDEEISNKFLEFIKSKRTYKTSRQIKRTYNK